jgi:hypothetical protein
MNNFGITTVSNYNAAYTGFSYWSNASVSNYAALGLWGQTIGTQTFNVVANGNFGIKTTTPAYTLDVVGTVNATILRGSHDWTFLSNVPSILSNSSSLGWSNITGQPVLLSNNGAISSATISNLTIAKGLLTIDDGNKVLIYSDALSTFNSNFTSTDGPVLYGWQGGALATSVNGGNFSIRQSNLTGTLYWNNTGVGIFRSNPAYELDINHSLDIRNTGIFQKGQKPSIFEYF